MSTTKIPNGHQTIMPYLMLDGAPKFRDFTTTVFGGTIGATQYQEDHPEQIRHSEVRIGDSTIMFCDSRPEWPAQPANLFVYVDNADDTYQKALDAGGTSVMPPADQDYGRSCGVADPCGNTWWITSVL
ncbi:VOC family protein [Dyadobacter fermentans]|uniref:Glyoxalase/bleomycin resistance protein/dioxygenase n=1 Tax=Dyadobacter fermentans (strain ATCC 700827 / DSM 18053 / CIP 107007 / KCTC 52180 / NS114) TaxID=471854 RepID=C6W4M8_DYAFD|nr:VOC family protein [Dyadobacter fermentans]ACT95852.1 Glyoxalase/bleomycin resistance protein/dioxygenase [Dyadobacter fermentans DSM 18053]